VKQRFSNFRFGFPDTLGMNHFCHSEHSEIICILSKKQLLLSIFAHSDAFAALSMTNGTSREYREKASRFSKAEIADNVYVHSTTYKVMCRFNNR
jgi:hypothetical protein